MKLNNKGLSLIEVLVGSVLLGLLVAAVAGLVTIITGGLRKAQNTQDEFNIANQIRTFLESEQSCRLALGGPRDYYGPNPANWAAAAAASPYSQIVAAAGQTPLKLYQPAPVNANRPKFLDASSSAIRTSAFNGLLTAENVIGNWTAVSITIEPSTGAFGGAGYFPATIRVRLKPTRETTTLGTMDLPPIPLTVLLDANRNIVSCSNSTFASDTSVVPVCPPLFVPNTTIDSGPSAVDAGPYLGCRQIKCDVANDYFPAGGWDKYGNILCSQINCSNSVIFGATGGVQTYTIPPGMSAIKLKVWGAGGGGGGPDANPGGPGGGGAFATRTLSVSARQQLTIFVGVGGSVGNGCGFGSVPGGAGGAQTGASGGASGWGGCSGSGGGGGGASYVTLGGVIQAVAGGGGGGGQWGGGGTGGGGTVGGGASLPVSGSVGQDHGSDGGGGGGGGVTGGAGGAAQPWDAGGDGGLGGSSFGAAASVGGSGQTQGQSSDTLNGGAGRGGDGVNGSGSGTGQSGANGRVAICY